jgi:hypothetical protein
MLRGAASGHSACNQASVFPAGNNHEPSWTMCRWRVSRVRENVVHATGYTCVLESCAKFHEIHIFLIMHLTDVLLADDIGKELDTL